MTVMAMVFLVFSSSAFLSSIVAKYAGCFGIGRDNDAVADALPFSKMDTTDDMSGLLLGSSWTHRRPTWMQSKASSGEQLPVMD